MSGDEPEAALAQRAAVGAFTNPRMVASVTAPPPRRRPGGGAPGLRRPGGLHVAHGLDLLDERRVAARPLSS